MKKLSKDGKIMIGLWTPTIIFSATVITLVIVDPLHQREEKPITLQNTKANIFSKSEIDLSSFLPSDINANVNDYFEYEIEGDKIFGTKYTWETSNVDNANGSIKVSIRASQAYVNGEIVKDKIIGEKIFQNLKKYNDTFAIINLKNGINSAMMSPSYVASSINNYFQYEVLGDVALGADYTLVASEVNDDNGSITVSLRASQAYVNGEIVKDEIIGEELFIDFFANINTFWDDTHTWQIEAKGTNGKIINLTWDKLEAPDSTSLTNKKVIIPNTIKNSGKEIQIVKLKQGLFNHSFNKVIEFEFEGDNLKTINNSIFQNNKLTSINIPTAITKIESYAFDNNEITNINFNDSLQVIEKRSFQNNKIENLILPNSVKYLSGFNNNLISSLEIPNSVSIIGEVAFSDNLLTNVVIPSSVQTIESYAFGNNQLNSIIIPSSVQTIGDGAFAQNDFSSSSIINLPTKFNTHEERVRIFGVDFWETKSHSFKSLNKTEIILEEKKKHL